MENSKLAKLLSKLDTMSIENDQNEFIILDEKCEYIISVNGGNNSSCTNGTCSGGTNTVCSNATCSGTNVRCSAL